MAGALNHFDLDQVYIRPAVRELLNRETDPSIMPYAAEAKNPRQNE